MVGKRGELGGVVPFLSGGHMLNSQWRRTERLGRAGAANNGRSREVGAEALVAGDAVSGPLCVLTA